MSAQPRQVRRDSSFALPFFYTYTAHAIVALWTSKARDPMMTKLSSDLDSHALISRQRKEWFWPAIEELMEGFHYAVGQGIVVRKDCPSWIQPRPEPMQCVDRAGVKIQIQVNEAEPLVYGFG